jgi:hypothetical protein
MDNVVPELNMVFHRPPNMFGAEIPLEFSYGIGLTCVVYSITGSNSAWCATQSYIKVSSHKWRRPPHPHPQKNGSDSDTADRAYYELRHPSKSSNMLNKARFGAPLPRSTNCILALDLA